MARIEDLFKQAEMLVSRFDGWTPKRKATVRTLRVLADGLQKHHDNVSIAQVAGSSTAIAAAIIGGVGFGLSFVTGGASLVAAAGIICGIGAGFGAAGGVVNAGSSITKLCIEKNTLKTAQRLIDEDREASKAIEKLLLKFEKERSKFKYQVFKGVLNTGSILTSCASVGFKVGVRATTKAASEASEALFSSLSKLAKVVHIGGFALSVALLPVDIHSLVTNSRKVHAARRGTRNKEPKKVRELRALADELEKNMPESDELVEGLDEFLSISISPDSDQ
ncbi:apolipoprotein L domain-containing protein 1-like [Acropora millepora]|uniref:apolipoprotein L domain-containing protein 1-like n=1 Tax=Acropora millepora TaxID=45264 RepID=UPI001CF3D851|nr:apolipoprotein L domain-containing protein 1-like [Acropora millepora]